MLGLAGCMCFCHSQVWHQPISPPNGYCCLCRSTYQMDASNFVLTPTGDEKLSDIANRLQNLESSIPLFDKRTITENFDNLDATMRKFINRLEKLENYMEMEDRITVCDVLNRIAKLEAFKEDGVYAIHDLRKQINPHRGSSFVEWKDENDILDRLEDIEAWINAKPHQKNES